MSNNTLPAETVFNKDVRALEFPEWEIRVRTINHQELYIAGGQRWDYWYINMDEARQLRDWLNKVLP